MVMYIRGVSNSAASAFEGEVCIKDVMSVPRVGDFINIMLYRDNIEEDNNFKGGSHKHKVIEVIHDVFYTEGAFDEEDSMGDIYIYVGRGIEIGDETSLEETVGN